MFQIFRSCYLTAFGDVSDDKTGYSLPLTKLGKLFTTIPYLTRWSRDTIYSFTVDGLYRVYDDNIDILCLGRSDDVFEVSGVVDGEFRL